MHVVAVPLHPPPQPEKRRPATGLAVRTTDWPAANVAVAELQVAVKAGTATTIQYASEQTLIKYRLEKLEAAGERATERGSK